MEQGIQVSRDTQLLERIRAALGDILATLTNRSYNMTVQVYRDSIYVPVARGCFAFMATQVGDTTATVNGMVLFPSATPLTALGDSRTIAAHKGDVYTGNITLSLLAPVGALPGVEIVQLYYTI
jgi:hypothetical protein